MRNIALAMAAAAVLTSAPLLIGTTPAKAEGLKMAQVDVQIGRDRDDQYRDRGERREGRERRDRDLTVGFGSGGLTVGPRQRCRNVTTTIDTDDGRRITKRERRCE
jgi:hypothetical protein